MRSRSLKKCVVVGAALVGLALDVPSAAQAANSKATEAGATSNEARARELMAEGLAAEEKGDLIEARRAYWESFEAHKSFDVAGNLGLVEVQLRQFVSAANHLAYCLRHFPTGENRELKAMVAAEFAKARQYVGGVKFDVNVVDAKVLVDGRVVAEAPARHEVYVLAGHHSAIAESADGSTSAEVDFAVAKGGSAEVKLTIGEDRASASASVSSAVASPVGDGAPEGRASGAEDSVGDKPVAKRNWVPAYVLGGLTVAAGGTSLVFRGLAGKKKGEIDDLRVGAAGACEDGELDHCSDLDSAIDRHDSLARLSNVSMIVAGVGAVATLGYVTYVLTRKEEKKPTVAASLQLNGLGGGVTLSGSF